MTSEEAKDFAVFQTLCSKGIDCHSFDMRSFGRSEPDRAQMGKIHHFDTLVDDLLDFVAQVKGGGHLS
jgi:alpha-beta hydrolase superfamily lysophospholipase